MKASLYSSGGPFGGLDMQARASGEIPKLFTLLIRAPASLRRSQIFTESSVYECLANLSSGVSLKESGSQQFGSTPSDIVVEVDYPKTFMLIISIINTENIDKETFYHLPLSIPCTSFALGVPISHSFPSYRFTIII